MASRLFSLWAGTRPYQIVGENESDISAGKISISSPLARALIGKKAKDSVEVDSPRGTRYYEIVNIKFA